MNYETFRQSEKELISLLCERQFIVYNSHTDQYLKEIRPIAINLENYKEEERAHIVMAASMCDGFIAGSPEWTNNLAEAYRGTTVYSVYFIVSTLLWLRNDFPHCRFFLIDDNDNIDYDDLFIWQRDHEFLGFLIDEYGEQ